MNNSLKLFLIVLLLGTTSISLAQSDSILVPQLAVRHNAFKMGYSITRLTFGFERTIIPIISVGASVELHTPRYIGWSGNLYARAYTHGFHRRGLYFEAKGMYGEYKPTCYSAYDTKTGKFSGEHIADITAIGITGSVGYRFMFQSGFLIEFSGGLRASKGTFGANDVYFKTDQIAGDYISVTEVFYRYGPGGPFEFAINIGYSF